MNTARVFIADYDEESLKRLTTVLRVAGFEVDSTRDGKQAIEIIERFKPKVCLIDPMIPGVDGFTLSQQVRSRFPDVATVISTAIYKGDRYRRDARVRYGVSAYLEKPYSDEKLLEILARLVLPEQAKARSFSAPEDVLATPPLPTYEGDGMDNTLGDEEESDGPVINPDKDLGSTVSIDPGYLDPELQRMRAEWTAAKKAQESLDFSESFDFPEGDESEMTIPSSAYPDENAFSDGTVADQVYNEQQAGVGNLPSDPDADYIMAPPEMNPPRSGKEPITEEENPAFLDMLSGLEQDDVEEDEQKPEAVAPKPTYEKVEPLMKLSSADIFGSVLEEVEEKSGMWKILPDQTSKESSAPESEQPVLNEVEPKPQVEGGDELAPLFEEDGALFLTEDDEDRTDPDPLAQAMENPEESADDGEYEFLELLGRDVISEFWKANRRGERGFEKIVTIRKVLPELSPDPTFGDMFSEEARVVANLNHPNISHIYELGRIGGDQYIAQEYLEGQTLEEVLRTWEERGAFLPPDIVAHIGLKLCNALFYAHHQKDFDGTPLHISHGNFTPATIIITETGETKIFGFGMNASEALARATIGTSNNRDPRYLPVGQPYDQSADIYGLGVILYRALTGSFPDRDAPQPPAERVATIPASLSEIVYSAIRPGSISTRLSARDVGNVLVHFFDEESEHLVEADLIERLKNVDIPEPTPQPEPQPEPDRAASVVAEQAAAAPPERQPKAKAVQPQKVEVKKAVSGESKKKALLPLALVGLLIVVLLIWFFTRKTPPPPLVEQPTETVQPATDPVLEPPVNKPVDALATEGQPPLEEEPSELDLELKRLKEEAAAKQEELKRLRELQKKEE